MVSELRKREKLRARAVRGGKGVGLVIRKVIRLDT